MERLVGGPPGECGLSRVGHIRRRDAIVVSKRRRAMDAFRFILTPECHPTIAGILRKTAGGAP
jgi:hypothetical protein